MQCALKLSNSLIPNVFPAMLCSFRQASSDASRSSCSGSAAGEIAAPLIDLAHADSGRLRTATMDSDCPTGLRFAPAEGLAWTPPQPQSQHSWQPVQPQAFAATRVQSAAAGGSSHTQQLLVHTAPERISEAGGSFQQSDLEAPATCPAAWSSDAAAAATLTGAALQIPFSTSLWLAAYDLAFKVIPPLPADGVCCCWLSSQCALSNMNVSSTCLCIQLQGCQRLTGPPLRR
jgi:hypothetical protein